MTARRPAALSSIPLVDSTASLPSTAAPQSSTLALGALRRARDIRGRYLMAIDLLGIVAAAYAALALALDRFAGPPDVPAFPLILVLLITVRITVNVLLGLYRRRWRFASLPELARIVWAAALGSLVGLTVFYGTAAVSGSEWTTGFPSSFWPIELMLSVAVLGGVRLGVRVAAERVRDQTHPGHLTRQPTLLYGAGEAGALIARSALRYPDSGVLPIGFLDDNPNLEGDYVAGLRVYGGLASLENAAASTGATGLLITMPSASGGSVRSVVEAAARVGLDVRIVPSVADLIDGSIDAHRLRRVRLEDLLRRPAVTSHAVDVEQIIRGHTVMITGGGGSIEGRGCGEVRSQPDR